MASSSKGRRSRREAVQGGDVRTGPQRPPCLLFCAFVLGCLWLAGGQVVDDTTSDLNLMLERSGGGAQDAAYRNFAEEKTLALDGDTMAVGSFKVTPACAGSVVGGSTVAGCILDYRMAQQLVDWFGEYDFKLAYSGSASGWTEAAFQTAMAAYPTSPSITVAFSYQSTGLAPTGAFVFGGYTSQPWSESTRCADAGFAGGSGTVNACNWFQSCASQANCQTYDFCGACCTECGNTALTCNSGTAPCPLFAAICSCDAAHCHCCADNTCTAVCGHVADNKARLFTLMQSNVHSFNLYSPTPTGQEIYTCSTMGPTWGPDSATAGKPPFSGYTLEIQITSRTGTSSTYNYNVGAANWPTGSAGWRLDELEVFALSTRTQYRSLFRYAPSGYGSSGDGSVHIFYRNQASGSFSGNAWGHLKRVVLPSFLDKYLYGWSVALDMNTLVVGRRGNRDIYIHDRHRSDCTFVGTLASGPLCADRGSYSANNWGVVQTLSWPGSRSSLSWAGEGTINAYGGIQETVSCSAVDPLTLCTPPATDPALIVGEWGVSVDVSNDWLIVGAYKSSVTPAANTHTGAAFVYQKIASTGDFAYRAALIGITTSYKHCGWDVAISGDYAVVGCYGSAALAGSVGFYENNDPDGSVAGTPSYGSDGNGGWALFAERTATACTNSPACTTTASDSSAGDFFGYSVDISGSTAIVGAFGVNAQAGAAYIFERNHNGAFAGTKASMWQVSKKLLPPDTAASLYFGFKVKIDGSYALVTAVKDNDGRGYLFARNYGGLNNWGYVKTLSQPTVGGSPGYATNLGGVGQLLNVWADGGGDHTGILQVQHGVPYYDDFTVTSVTVTPGFGRSAALTGNTAVIGSPTGDLSATDGGVVSVFSLLPSNANSLKRFAEQIVVGGGAVTGDRYGHSVHVFADGSLIAVGAPGSIASQVGEAGVVYVLRLSPSGALSQIAALSAASPVAFANFGGGGIGSVYVRDDDQDDASHELLIGVPGEDNSNFPAFPRQSVASSSQYRSGAVFVFSKARSWGTSTLASALAVNALSIVVVSATDLMGVSTTGTVYIGQNTVTITGVNFATNTLTTSGTVVHAEVAGTVCIAALVSTHPTQGFRQTEKLTALTTSCGAGGLDFQAVYNDYAGANTHVSDYSTGAMLLQPIVAATDTEICVSSAAALFGAHFVGGTAPRTDGDADDVIMWIKIGDTNTNPAVAVKNTMTLGTCAPGLGNSWTGTVAGDKIAVVTSTLLTDVTAPTVASTVYLYSPPYYAVAPPYPSCLDGEYVASGRVPGGSSVVATWATTGGVYVTAPGYAYGWAYLVGATSFTVQSASQLFQVKTFGLIASVTSSSSFTLPPTASNVAGFYVGYDITIDLDGITSTTGDVETRSISGYNAGRVVSVSAAFTSAPTTASIFHISNWQSRPYITTGYNPVITVTGVNFITSVLTVSGGVVAGGFINDAVRQTAPSSTQLRLEETSPSVPSLYVKSTIHIVQGRGAGQSRTVTAYDGYAKIVTVSPPWVIWPDTTSEYVITGKPLCVNGCKDDKLGFSVSVGRSLTDRHVMAVGAPFADSHTYCVTRPDRGKTCLAYQTPLYQSGRVYLYERHGHSTTNKWKMVQILEAPTTGAAANTQGDAGPMSMLELLSSATHEAASYDHFGYSVAVMGDEVFVGAPHSGTTDSGAVFVYERNYHVFILNRPVDCTVACTTTSFSMAAVPASEPYSTAPVEAYYVGYSVTIGSETRTISSYTIRGMSPAGTADYGQGGNPIFTVSSPFSFTPTNVMTFTLSSGAGGARGLQNKWGFKQLITPAVPAAADMFGFSIAVSAGLLVVGAPGVDIPRTNLANSLTDAGAVYVFVRNAGVSKDASREHKKWTEYQKLTQSSASSVQSGVGSRLGQSVAVNKQGDTIIAGAPLVDVPAFRTNAAASQAEGVLPSAGAVAVFRKSPVETSTTVAADFAVGATSISVFSASDLLGSHTASTISIGKNPAVEVIAVAGNTLTVVAETVMYPSTNVAGSRESALAFRSRGEWKKDELYSSGQASAGGRFGSSVALWDNGLALVGAPFAESAVACCGSSQNAGVRGGTAHLLEVSRLNASLDYYGKDVETGVLASVTDGSTFIIAPTGSEAESAYLYHKIVIGGVTRNIIQYKGATRQVTVDVAFGVVPSAGNSYAITSTAGFTGVLNSELYPGESCFHLLEDGYNKSGYYWLRTRFSNDTQLRSAFVGYCDQVSEGGGWLMCYTDDDEVDFANEYAHSGSRPYGTKGYRSDCRNYLFNQVVYVLHYGELGTEELEDKVFFRAKDGRPILAADSLWDGYPAHDVYGKLLFSAYSPLTGPDKSMPYQLLLCANGRGAGFMMSGVRVTDTCTDGFKTCTSWCKDRHSDYFRHAFSPKENVMYSASVNFTGVAFRENGHRRLGRKMMSVGIRNRGTVCQSGWMFDGVRCMCPALMDRRDQFAYWRFEDGEDDTPAWELVKDVTRRTGFARFDDSSMLAALGSGQRSTLSTDNDLEFVTGSVPLFSRYAPTNQTFASLCLPNKMSLECSGAEWLRTIEYAAMNSMSFTAGFTWECSVYFKDLTGAQTLLSWHNNANSFYMSLAKTAANNYEWKVVHTFGTVTASSLFVFQPKKWYHLAVTYDGGSAGRIRLYHANMDQIGLTGSDCFDANCLIGIVSGTIGKIGNGVGNGITILGGAMAGCSVGDTISAVGGGVCVNHFEGIACTVDADCGTGGTCRLGSGFAATITAVTGGAITQIYITNTGADYGSRPSLVISSAACMCGGNAGNVPGNFDACLLAIRSVGEPQLRSRQWLFDNVADAAWDSFTGWANKGDVSGCTSASTEPCPWVSILSTSDGWRWSVGRTGGGTDFLKGYIDEIRLHSRALDLPSESLWRV